jgi:hypothetical protein
MKRADTVVEVMGMGYRLPLNMLPEPLLFLVSPLASLNM